MIAHDVAGDGTPLVLLAGLPFDRSTWDAVLPHLASARVVRCDLRGLGASRHMPGSYDLETHANDVVALLDELGIAKAVVAGHSLGGYVGQMILRNHPHRLAGLALISSAVAADSPECAAIHDERIALFESWGTTMHVGDGIMAKMFAGDYVERHPAEYAQATAVANLPSASAVAAMVRAIRFRPDSSSLVREASIPIIGVIGGHDVVIPHDDMADALGDRLRLLPEAGHMLPMETPAEVAESISGLVVHAS